MAGEDRLRLRAADVEDLAVIAACLFGLLPALGFSRASGTSLQLAGRGIIGRTGVGYSVSGAIGQQARVLATANARTGYGTASAEQIGEADLAVVVRVHGLAKQHDL